MASISKWFVGSSKNKMSGLDNNNFKKAILVLSPPEKSPIFLFLSSLVKPNFFNIVSYSFW